jgi:hypothetical protein
MRRLQLLRRQHLYSCTSKASKLSACRSRSMIARLEHTESTYVSTRQHTSAYVSIRQHTSAYVSIPAAYLQIPEHDSEVGAHRVDDAFHLHTSAYVSIRQHTSAYVSIRQHTSASESTTLFTVITLSLSDSTHPFCERNSRILVILRSLARKRPLGVCR